MAFPRLLKLLWDSMAPTVGDNLMAGFRTCGLLPLDRSNALKKLPEVVCNPTNNEEETRTVLNESLMSLLQVNKKRSNDDEEKEKRGKRLPKPKRKQANVPPGLGLELVPPVAGDLLEVAFIPNGETDITPGDDMSVISEVSGGIARTSEDLDEEGPTAYIKGDKSLPNHTVLTVLPANQLKKNILGVGQFCYWKWL